MADLNVPPHVWGGSEWPSWLVRAFAAPLHPTPAEVGQLVGYFSLAAALLPCASCRVDALAYIGDGRALRAAAAQGRAALPQWVVDFKNAVNLKQGKPQRAFDDVAREWSQRMSCAHDCGETRGGEGAGASATPPPCCNAPPTRDAAGDGATRQRDAGGDATPWILGGGAVVVVLLVGLAMAVTTRKSTSRDGPKV